MKKLVTLFFSVCCIIAAAGCSQTPPPAQKNSVPDDESRAKLRLEQEMPKNTAKRAKPSAGKKAAAWERHSVKKRAYMTDTSRSVLLNGGNDESKVFFWRDDSERRSEKLHEEQRKKFRNEGE